MGSKYIELNRSFKPIPKDIEFGEDEEEFSSYFSLAIEKPQKWDDLLKLQRTIILAEAGAGKTEELRNQTKQLRKDGKKAFFFRLEHLSSDFELSFGIGNGVEFEEWLASDESGWFFLDSVDEAKLKGPFSFEEAIGKFSLKLGEHKQRAHIYITCRASEWRRTSDISLIQEKLPFFEMEPLPDEEKEDEYDDYEDEMDGTSKSSSTPDSERVKKWVEPALFSFCSLDSEQIKKFSKSYGAPDLDSFLKAVKKAEADIFTDRPEDLISLISFWKKNKRISNYQTMLEANISIKLTERDPRRENNFPLSEDDALYGAERFAAAASFMKRSRILIPDSSSDSELESETIDVRKILPAWDFLKIKALLQRPIFDEEIYGTVRFHHRSVKEYLTAKWLHRLLLKGKSRREIEGIFIKERYGQIVLVPSLRPILSWLIIFDEGIRDRVRKIAPEIFVQGGDPSALPLDFKNEILKEICSQCAEKGQRRPSVDIYELRRFAHPDLSDTINHLLDKYSHHSEIRQLLLRIIWQGSIRHCADNALNFALNNKCDIYSRINGIRAVEEAGTEEQKIEMIEALVADSSFKNEKLIGELVGAFSPKLLPTKSVLKLVGRIKRLEKRADSWLRGPLEEFCKDGFPQEEILEWAKGILILLKKPPYVERRHFEISNHFAWLLPFASMAVERLLREKSTDALEENVLELITLAGIARDYNYHHSEKDGLAELIPSWPDMNRALFWYGIKISRKKLDDKGEGERLTGWWQGIMGRSYWKFSEKDFDQILDDIRNKSNLDDRLVALSLAFSVYKEHGRGQVRRQALKKAVLGVPELEKELKSFLNPPPMTDEQKKERRRHYQFEQRQKQRKKKRVENRKGWKKWLKENTSVLRDTSIAENGKIWTATSYLMEQLREKPYVDTWAKPEWEKLIPEFGKEVAEAYRDGCMDYWRKYCPEISSEGTACIRSVRDAVRVGITGIVMESKHIANWPMNLSEDEVKLACRYAVREFNEVPDWVKALHSTFPDIVETLLLSEIEWEFKTNTGEQNFPYVLSEVANQSTWLIPVLSERVVGFLADYEPKHEGTLRDALKVVLNSPNLDCAKFIEIARGKLEKDLDVSRKAIWLSVWMCIDSKGALEILNFILKHLGIGEASTDLAMHFIATLLCERRISISVRGDYMDYQQVDILLPLIKLMYVHVKSSEDIHHRDGKVFSPVLRDNAQDGRNRLEEILRKIPGKPTFLALLDLSKNHPDKKSHEWYSVCAKKHVANDSEGFSWKVEDISSFAEEVEKVPQSHRELYELGISKLLDLKADLEDGDESISHFLKLDKSETKHRVFIGGWLRGKNHGRYNVPQEEELADGKKTDFRLHNSNFDGPVPIELKIAENYSGAKLLERLQNQLCGQYLRDIRSNCGIYLLVYLGGNKWEHPITGIKLNFDELIRFLEEEAQKIVSSSSKIEDLQVIGIDLTKRTAPAPI